jgi:hypothetical protein
MTDAAVRIEEMAEQNRQAVNLARLLSFAVLIEPALMRAMRLELLPQADVSAEADLWFGPLVQTRSRDGIVLLPDVAERLRSGLQEKLARRCWCITKRLHDYLPPAVSLEEELNWLSLDPTGNAQAITDLLQSALTALIGQSRDEVANWAGRALPRLPHNVRATDGAAMLAVASDLRLGRTRTLPEHLRGRAIPPWFANLVPPGLAKVELGVSATSLELTFDPTPASDAPHINVPDTDPRVLQISVGGDSQIVFIEAKTPQSVPLSLDAGAIELTTIAGEAFTLERIFRAGTASDRALASTAYANCNQALVVWQLANPLHQCLGFALERIDVEGTSEFVQSFVGFRTAAAPQPTNLAPFQRFIWTDRPPQRGVSYSYRITPVIGAPNKFELIKDLETRTGPVDVAVKRQGSITAVFNGRLSASRQVPISQEALGGEVRRLLVETLKNAQANLETTIYAALWMLDDEELIDAINSLGGRAHIVLSGDKTVSRTGRLATAREGLRGVELRIRSNINRFSHTSFMVVCLGGKARAVWTGSVLWTRGHIDTQDSNAVLIEDPVIAESYLAQWQRLRSDPPTSVMVASNERPATATLSDGSHATLWFAPVRNGVDTANLRRHLDTAKQGILFAVGARARTSVVNDIPRHAGRVYVAGVARSPDAGREVMIYQNQSEVVVKPERVAISALRAAGLKTAMPPIGSRMIVIDPFSDNSVVIVGSHLLSDGASAMSDEDLVIIEGNRTLAEQCAVHVKGLIDHYAFLASTRGTKDQTAILLRPDDKWQRPFLTGDRAREIQFWMGVKGPSVPHATAADVRAPPQPPQPAKKVAKKTPAKKKSAGKKAAKKKSAGRKTAKKKSVARKLVQRKSVARKFTKKKSAFKLRRRRVKK